MCKVLRIAIFTETFLPKVDGIVNTLCHYLEHLATRDHQVLLFAPSGGPQHYNGAQVAYYRGFSCPLYPELKLVPPFAGVGRPLKAFQPDIVHSVNPVSIGLAGMLLARSMDVPLVVSYHTDIPGYTKRWQLGVLERPLWSAFRWVYNQSDMTLCPSNWTLAELQKQGFRNLRLWTRGVDTERFHPGRYSPEWRERLGKGDTTAPLLLYVGRLSPEKRVEWLRPLLEAFPRARLAIVGDGPARPKLQDLFAGTRTVFTGYLRGIDLARAYASADVFLFPSANETLGNVVLEAMASGLPVVAADAGGQLDLIVEGESGLLFDSSNQVDFLRVVSRVLSDIALARRLGRKAREYALTRSWARLLDELLHDFRLLIERKVPV